MRDPASCTTSVIVRSHDSEATIRACLASVAAQTARPQIVVVDSGSTDSTMVIAAGYADRIVHLPPVDFSFGRALNRGVDVCSGSVIFALSSHVVAPGDDWIERSLRHYDDPRVVATCGAEVDADALPLRRVLRLDGAAVRASTRWGLSNTAASWRAELVRRVPFDEHLPACEDKEWTFRALQGDAVLVIDPSLHVDSSHRRDQGLLAYFGRLRREHRALLQFGAQRPLGPAGTVREWWRTSASPPPGHRGFTSWTRAVEALGHLAAERDFGEAAVTTPQISVVIPTHNRLALLRRGLDVVLDDPACAEVVVVADGCSDATEQFLSDLADRDSRVVPVFQSPGRGAARARLAGVAAASGEVVLCLDDDVLPAPDLVSGHARAHVGADHTVVLGYMPTQPPEPLRAGMYATREYGEVYEELVTSFEAAPEKILTQFWAGNFSLPRTDYLATSGRPAFVERHEDQELGLRLAAAGMSATFDRGLRGDHQHARDWHTYLREGAAQGRDTFELSRRYPSSVVCEPWAVPAETNPGVRALLHVARIPGAAAPMTAALHLATVLAGRAGRFDLEKKLAHVAKDVAWHRAAAAALLATR